MMLGGWYRYVYLLFSTVNRFWSYIFVVPFISYIFLVFLFAFLAKYIYVYLLFFENFLPKDFLISTTPELYEFSYALSFIMFLWFFFLIYYQIFFWMVVIYQLCLSNNKFYQEHWRKSIDIIFTPKVIFATVFFLCGIVYVSI
ncbi:MAG: hypothetical protein Q3971_09695 [Moraxella sp.]|nr:hypothetical protein [Moraxella sp.]